MVQSIEYAWFPHTRPVKLYQAHTRTHTDAHTHTTNTHLPSRVSTGPRTLSPSPTVPAPPRFLPLRTAYSHAVNHIRAQIQSPAPAFTTDAVVNGDVSKVRRPLCSTGDAGLVGHRFTMQRCQAEGTGHVAKKQTRGLSWTTGWSLASNPRLS